VVRALARPETSGEVINIGGDEPIRIVDLAQRVQTAMGIAGPLRTKVVPLANIGGRYEDVYHRLPSTVKAKRLLGFEAQIGLEQGLQATLDWHLMLREEQAEAAEAA
jgi:nucleoside-diphosphate-sugar epimerase